MSVNRRVAKAVAAAALATAGALALWSPGTARAQASSKDVVELADGTRVEGSFVELKRGSYVVIELASGQQQTIPWAKVKNVIRASDAPTPAPPPAPSASSSSSPASAPPPGQDAVVLKDGTRITGQVIEQRPGKFVTIKAADGAHTLAWDVVQEVIGGPPASVESAAPPPSASAAPPPPPAPSPSAAPEAAPPTPTSPAEDAQPKWTISVDRLFGVYAWNVTQSASGASSTSSGVSGSALVGTTSPDAVPALAFHTPRLSLDYTLGSITVGGAVGFFAGSSTLNATSGSSNNGGPGLFMYLVEPRVGYLLPLGKHFVFWPRVGISLFGYSQSSTPAGGGSSTTVSESGFALDLEPTLALRLTPWGGLTVSGLADIGVGGSYSVSGSSQSISSQSSSYGVTFGMYVGF
jgi:hypothetical protein